MIPFPRLLQIKKNPETQNTESKTIKITDNTGKTIALILLKSGMPSRPGGHPGFPGFPGPANELGFVILLAGSALSLFMGFYINKNFINPLLILSDALKQIQSGNLTFELDTGIKQEQILNTFNNFNLTVKSLREKEKLRKSFVTNLTHDLKTPLIAQERALGLISEEFKSLDMKDAYELADGTQKNNKHLLRMVDLILESYRFDSEELNLIISNINISELINGCFEKLNPLASEKNIQLLSNICDELPLINGDITSFKRVFLNLVSNSIDNLSINGKVEISAAACSDFMYIFVEDNGPGIAQEDLIYIYDRYYTGKSGDRKIGSGLGLYVCKKLIETHGGELSAESEINKYTKFIVKLPLNKENL